MFGSSLLPFVLLGVHVLFMLFVFVYLYWGPTRFPHHMMFVSFNMTGTTVGTGENHRPIESHWQTLSHNVVSSTSCHERGSNTQL